MMIASVKTDLDNYAQQPRAAKRFRRCSSAYSGGFSLLELMIVVAIACVVMAIAVPTILNAVNSAKLRGQISSLSGIVQACRSQAVQLNATKQLLFAPSGGEWVAYVDDLPQKGLVSSATQMWLPGNLSKASQPTGTPTPLDSSIMWGDGLGTVPETLKTLCFNPRGIPCECPANPANYCQGITNSYAYYFTLKTQYGNLQWAAVGVSRAGRIKTYYWNGSAWSN
jgi:prepilin-type N-terminal cleavage/methylation domain-containing protein